MLLHYIFCRREGAHGKLSARFSKSEEIDTKKSTSVICGAVNRTPGIRREKMHRRKALVFHYAVSFEEHYHNNTNAITK